MPSPGYPDLNLPHRILLGPGPSNVHPRVQQAMTAPMVGYLEPELFKVMDDIMALLRPVFGTKNAITFPGSASMEAALGGRFSVVGSTALRRVLNKGRSLRQAQGTGVPLG